MSETHQTSDPSGNRVAQVMVSPSTRRDARNIPDPKPPNDNIKKLETERLELCNFLRECQTQLATLNAAVRGKQLKQSTYDSIVEKQTDLKEKIAKTSNRLAEVKKSLREIGNGSEPSYLEFFGRLLTEQKKTNDGIAKINNLLAQILSVLEERQKK